MKKIVFLFIALSPLFFTSSSHAQDREKWKEMEAFHEVMSQTFHPAAEGKLEPIRARSAEMVEKATAWEQSTPPKGYNKDAGKQLLADLVKGAKEVDQLVKEKAADATLKEKLSALHDVFHQAMDKM